MLIIYGKKENCPQCRLSTFACEIRRAPYEYLIIGVDAAPNELTIMAGVPIRSAPAIFERDDSGRHTYIGGYQELRQWLKHNNPRKSL